MHDTTFTARVVRLEDASERMALQHLGGTAGVGRIVAHSATRVILEDGDGSIVELKVAAEDAPRVGDRFTVTIRPA